MTRELYTLAIPRDTRLTDQIQQQNDLSIQGVLSQDTGAVEAVAPQPGERLLRGQYRGPLAEQMAEEIEELFGASDIDAVPFAERGGRSPVDGYYELRDVTTDSAVTTDAEGSRRAQSFDGTLQNVGTRRSHLRAVRAAAATVDNPFGSGSTEEIAIANTATDVRWYNDLKGTAESATVQRTTTGQFGTFAVYDVTEPSFDNPWLVYDQPLLEQSNYEVRVWDDHDRAKSKVLESRSADRVGSTTVSTDSTVSGDPVIRPAWQRVFGTAHEPEGTLIVESNRLRLTLDDEGERLRAERWSASDDLYSPVDLGNTAWRLRVADIRRIGLARLRVRCTFGDGNSRREVDIILRRGFEDALIVDQGSASFPSGLDTRLSPIATTTDQDPSEVADLVDRSEVPDA